MWLGSCRRSGSTNCRRVAWTRSRLPRRPSRTSPCAGAGDRNFGHRRPPGRGTVPGSGGRHASSGAAAGVGIQVRSGGIEQRLRHHVWHRLGPIIGHRCSFPRPGTGFRGHGCAVRRALGPPGRRPHAAPAAGAHYLLMSDEPLFTYHARLVPQPRRPQVFALLGRHVLDFPCPAPAPLVSCGLSLSSSPTTTSTAPSRARPSPRTAGAGGQRGVVTGMVVVAASSGQLRLATGHGDAHGAVGAAAADSLRRSRWPGPATVAGARVPYAHRRGGRCI